MRRVVGELHRHGCPEWFVVRRGLGYSTLALAKRAAYLADSLSPDTYEQGYSCTKYATVAELVQVHSVYEYRAVATCPRRAGGTA